VYLTDTISHILETNSNIQILYPHLVEISKTKPWNFSKSTQLQTQIKSPTIRCEQWKCEWKSLCLDILGDYTLGASWPSGSMFLTFPQTKNHWCGFASWYQSQDPWSRSVCYICTGSPPNYMWYSWNISLIYDKHK